LFYFPRFCSTKADPEANAEANAKADSDPNCRTNGEAK
jgi:hypothetical protein